MRGRRVVTSEGCSETRRQASSKLAWPAERPSGGQSVHRGTNGSLPSPSALVWLLQRDSQHCPLTAALPPSLPPSLLPLPLPHSSIPHGQVAVRCVTSIAKPYSRLSSTHRSLTASLCHVVLTPASSLVPPLAQ